MSRWSHYFPGLEVVDGPFLKTENGELTWERFLDSALERAPAVAAACAREFFVDERSYAAVIELTLAGMMAGRIPVLGSAGENLPSLTLASLPRTSAVPVPLRSSDVALVFSTSGSTGESKMVPKTWSQLVREAGVLARTFSLPEVPRYLTLVPPIHIYGFLFGFLMPLATRGMVFPADLSRGPWCVEDSDFGWADAIVSVPAVWSLVARSVEERHGAKLLFSSGAPLGAERVRDFLARKSKVPEARLVEVLGSTETGGIAYRDASLDGPYELFQGVDVVTEAGETFVVSFVADPEGRPVAVSDDLEKVSPRQIVHKGRKDRVIKFGGRRESLAAIEANLSRCLAGRPVRCFFEADADHVRGGEISAFVVAPDLDVMDLRSRYLKECDTPFPQKIFRVPALPTNEMGKVTLEGLRAVAVEPGKGQ